MEIYNGNYCVYVHINKINGKMYVGQTRRNPKYRWRNGKGYQGSTCFYSAIEKYGWDNFEHEVIASNLTKKEADNFEQILIKELKTQEKKYGYNICDGGNMQNSMRGKHLSEEQKRKLSESRKGENNPMYGIHLCGERNGMYGKHHTEEMKRLMSERFSGDGGPMYGKHHTEESKQKNREAHIGKYDGEKNPFYGKKHSEETRKKISEARRKRKDDGAKPVIQLDDSGNFIKYWESISAAWKTLGICRTSIPNCINGKVKHAGGYRWVLASEYYCQLNEDIK